MTEPLPLNSWACEKCTFINVVGGTTCSMCGTSAEVKADCSQNKMNEAFDCVRVRYDIYEEVKWVDSRDALKMASQNLNKEESLRFCCKYMYSVVKIFGNQVNPGNQWKDCFVDTFVHSAEIIAHVLNLRLENHFKVLDALPILFKGPNQLPLYRSHMGVDVRKGFIEKFIELNGFRLLASAVEYISPLGLSKICSLLETIEYIKEAKDCNEKIVQCVLRRVNSISSKSLPKTCGHWCVVLKDLVSYFSEDPHRNREIRNHYHRLIEYTLRSDRLNNRLIGLENVQNVVQKDPNIVSVRRWLLEDIKVLSLLFNDRIHERIVAKSRNLMKELTRRAWLTVKDVCLIWEAALGKHGALVKEISELLAIISTVNPLKSNYGISENNNASLYFSNSPLNDCSGSNSSNTINLVKNECSFPSDKICEKYQQHGLCLGILQHIHERAGNHATETLVFLDAVLRCRGDEFQTTHRHSSSANSGFKLKINPIASKLFFGTVDRAKVTIDCLQLLVLKITNMNEDIGKRSMLFELFKVGVGTPSGENLLYPSMCRQLEYIRNTDNKEVDEVKRTAAVSLLQQLLQAKNDKRLREAPQEGLNHIIKCESQLDVIDFLLDECKKCCTRLARRSDPIAIDAIEVRLKSLGFIAQKKSLLNFNHIQQLWDSFFQCHNCHFMDILMDWLFVGRDDGTKRMGEEVNAYFGDEVAYQILVSLFGHKTGLTYCDTKQGFKAFRNFFLGLNQWTKLGIRRIALVGGGEAFRFVGLDHINSQEQETRTIYGLDTVWKICMECLDMNVFESCKELIIDGCNVENPKHIPSHTDPVKLKILKRLKMLLSESHRIESEAAIRKTERALNIIQSLLKNYFFKKKYYQDGSLGKLTCTVAIERSISEGSANNVIFNGRKYLSALISLDYAAVVNEIYDLLLVSLSPKATKSHIRMMWNFLKSLPPRPGIMEDLHLELHRSPSDFGKYLPQFSIQSTSIMQIVSKIKIVHASIVSNLPLFCGLDSKECLKPWLQHLLRLSCCNSCYTKDENDQAYPSPSTSHCEQTVLSTSQNKMQNNRTLWLREVAISAIHIVRLLQLRTIDFVDTEWLQYLVQMILSWGDNETIVSISIQIIFDNLCDNEEKKLFLSNQSSFVLRILCLESKFVDIQLHASRFVHNVVKETDDVPFLASLLRLLSFYLEDGIYLSAEDVFPFFTSLSCVITQLKITSENWIAQPDGKRVVTVLSEKLMFYSTEFSGKQPFKCIDKISECLCNCLSEAPGVVGKGNKQSMQRVAYLGMKNDPLGTLTNLMVGILTRNRLGVEGREKERLSAIQSLCKLFQLFSCLDEQKWVIAMHQIGEFIEEHFPVKDVQMPNTPSRMFRHVHVGLKNQGNTCYMNSLIQQLYMMNHLFRGDFLGVDLPRLLLKMDRQTTRCGSQKVDQRSGAYKICYELQRTFLFLAGSDKRSFDTKNLVAACKHLKLYYSVTSQNDTREFCDKLMATIDESKIQRLTCCLRRCFGGQTIGQSNFRDCGHVSETRDSFTTIEIPVKDMHTLERAFQSYVRSEVMDGADAIHCDMCGQKRVGIRRTCFDINKLPKCLIIHLKRFVTDMVTGDLVKVQDKLEFPNKLDMAPFTGQVLDAKSGVKPKPRHYNLKGVIVHDGDLNTGHYFSYIQDRETHRWYHFDDENVIPFDPGRIANECFDGGKGRKKRSAYMLFYEEVDDESNFQQNNIMKRNISKATSMFSHKRDSVDTVLPKRSKISYNFSASQGNSGSIIETSNNTLKRARSLSFDTTIQTSTIFPKGKKRKITKYVDITDSALERKLNSNIEESIGRKVVNFRKGRRRLIVQNKNLGTTTSLPTSVGTLRDQILSELKLEPYMTLIRLNDFINCFCSILNNYLRINEQSGEKQKSNAYDKHFDCLLKYFFHVLVYQKDTSLDKSFSLLNFVIEEHGQKYALRLLQYLCKDESTWNNIVKDAPSEHLTLVKVVVRKAVKKCNLSNDDKYVLKLGVQNVSTGKKEVDDRHNSIDLTGDDETGIVKNMIIAAKSLKPNTLAPSTLDIRPSLSSEIAQKQ